MRLVTWNCCGGPLSSKLAALATLAPDIAVVPECPRIEVEPGTKHWFGDDPHRGIAVMSSLPFELRPIDAQVDLPRYVIPLQVTGPSSFLLLAVWAQNDGADAYVRGVVRAVCTTSDLLRSQPSVIMGDFNSNAIWDSDHPEDKNHTALVRALDDLGLRSVYHEHYARPTAWKLAQPSSCTGTSAGHTTLTIASFQRLGSHVRGVSSWDPTPTGRD